MTPIPNKTLFFAAGLVLLTAASSMLSEWAPLIVAIGIVFIASILRGTEIINSMLFLAIPLSVEMGVPGLGDLMFPSELLATLMFCFAVVNMLVYRSFWRPNSVHPASVALLFVWLGLCYATYSSNMFSVSLKNLIIFSIYLTTFYLQWFWYPKDASKKVESAILHYFLGLLIVCLYITFKHSQYGFARPMAMRVPPPFYSDHTIYGTCMAFFIPMLYYWIRTSTVMYMKLFYTAAMGLFIMAIFTTYSRAVWMSLCVVLVMNYLLKLRITTKKLGWGLAIGLVAIFLFQETALQFLSQNRSDSKARTAEVSDQLKSVGNISTDVSNLERINRWKSAWAMFQEKPLSGHGPGTYQFNFIPFQRPEDKTPISVNRASDKFSQGMGGTAHSQYLLFASESGIITLIAFIACVLYTIKEAFNLHYHSTSEKEKMYIRALLGGYITFVFHSFFNNFLDIDKSASLFFIFNAGIILLAVEKKRELLRTKTTTYNGN